jgi:hypothetical protein
MNSGTLEFLFLLLQQSRFAFFSSASSVALYNYTAFGCTADHEYFWRTPNLDPITLQGRPKTPPVLPPVKHKSGSGEESRSDVNYYHYLPLGLDDDIRPFSSVTGQTNFI